MSRRRKAKAAPVTVAGAEQWLKRRAGARMVKQCEVVILAGSRRPPTLCCRRKDGRLAKTNNNAQYFTRTRVVAVGVEWLREKQPAVLAPFLGSRILGGGSFISTERL